MANDDQQPDIYSFRTKEDASSESAALDEALLDTVNGIAQSLRDEERSLRKGALLRRRRQIAIFGSIFVATVAVPLFLLSYPHQFQELATEWTEAPKEKDTRAVDEKLLNSLRATNTFDDPRLRSGNFTMLLPRGFEWQVKLLALGNRRYRLTSKRNLNSLGIYELQGDRLVMVEPDDKRLTEFQWLITNRDSLELVAEPPARKTSSTYLGTALSRNLESE